MARTASAQVGEADFLLFPQPGRLVLLNEYQQTPGREERNALLPFVPMRVIKADLLLPDGYTHCAQVEVGGKSLFLLKSQDGSFLGTERSGPPTKLTGALLRLDTLKAREPIAIQSPDRRTTHTLQKGDLFVVHFQHKSGLYVQTIGRATVLGWMVDGITAPGQRWERLDRTAAATTRALSSVLPRLKARIEEVNAVLAGIFSEFNRKTGQQKPAPSWELSLFEAGITCELRSPPFVGAFRESTILLARDIQNMLLGTSASVSFETGKITIRDAEM